MLAHGCGILDVEHEVQNDCVVCCLHVVAEVLTPDNEELVLVDQRRACRRVSIAEGDVCEFQCIGVILEVDDEACCAGILLHGDRNCHVLLALLRSLGADVPADLAGAKRRGRGLAAGGVGAGSGVG